MAKIFFFLFLGFSLLSCSETYEDCAINVIVTDKVSGKPVPNAKIYLAENKGSGSIMGGVSADYLQEFIGKTNSDGKITFLFDNPSHSWGVLAVANSKQYFSSLNNYYNEDTLSLFVINPNKDFSSLKNNEKNQNLYLNLSPKAYVLAHLKNINPLNNNDEISFYTGQKLKGSSSIYGANVDTIVELKPFLGNQTNNIEYLVNRNGFGGRYSLPVYTPAHDTILVDILY